MGTYIHQSFCFFGAPEEMVFSLFPCLGRSTWGFGYEVLFDLATDD